MKVMARVEYVNRSDRDRIGLKRCALIESVKSRLNRVWVGVESGSGWRRSGLNRDLRS